VRVGFAAVAVSGHAGEQPGAAAWPCAEDVFLLGADRGRGLGAERDQLLGAHLGGLKPQARPADTVIQHRVERQGAGVPAAQPGLHENHDQVAGRGVRDLRQRLLGFELGHHELRDEPGYLVVVGRELFDVDHRAGRQLRQPAVPVAGLGEHPQHAQRQRPGGGRVALAQQPGQVVLQNRARDAGLAGNAGVAAGQERREPGHGQRPGADGGKRAPGGQPQPRPPLDRLPQPVLGDGAGPGRAPPAGTGTPSRQACQRSLAYSPSSPAAWPPSRTGRSLGAALIRRLPSRPDPTPQPGSAPRVRRQHPGGCRPGWWWPGTGG
jgi:hypothetical protein